jgi:hypothetical protein
VRQHHPPPFSAMAAEDAGIEGRGFTFRSDGAACAQARSIWRSIVVPVDNNHHCRRKSVNHRRDTDDGGHGGEHGRNFRRDKPGREEAQAAEKGNQTSSSRLPRVVALHAMRIVRRLAVCTGGLC